MDRAGRPVSSAQRSHEATQIVHRYAVYVGAATAGWNTAFWPVSSPLVTALQLKMLRSLAEHYGIAFSPASAKPLIASLAGGAMSYVISRMPILMAVKTWMVAIPVIGVPLRFATGPILLAAYTTVVGKAFARHFEAGGSVTDFDVRRFKVEALRAIAEVSD